MATVSALVFALLPAGAGGTMVAAAVSSSIPTTAVAPQGDWVGAFGSQGYVLGAWNGSSNSVSTSDQVVLPAGTTFTLDQGARWCWTCPTTDVRGLQSANQAQRRAGTWYHPTQLRARLGFASAYTGTLRVYALDWDTIARRQRVSVNDGTGARSVDLSTDFRQGAWISFPVTVGAGGTVTITVDRLAGANAVLAGIFLGDAGPPLAPPPPPPSAPQGDWVGAFGSQGYVLGAWNGSSNSVSTSDQVVLPAGTTFTLDQGARWCWTCPTTDVRGLQSANQAQRRAGTWYHPTQLRARLGFASAYTGTLRVYALDWDTIARRQRVSVNDGTGARSVDLSTDFRQGAWISFPVTVGAGGTVNITVDRLAGANAVLAGIFLGEGAPFTPPPPPTAPPTTTPPPTTPPTTPPATPPPTTPPPYQSAPQGNWVNTFGSQGYVLADWTDATKTDLSVLPAGVTFALDQGTRTCWGACTTSDVRLLRHPLTTERHTGDWWHATEVRAHLTFTNAYTGNLRLYALDLGAPGTRRQTMTVTDANGPDTIAITTSFTQGAWATYPITVNAGGTVTITVARTGTNDADLQGIFLGDAGPPPTPSSTTAPPTTAPPTTAPPTTAPPTTAPPTTAPPTTAPPTTAPPPTTPPTTAPPAPSASVDPALAAIDRTGGTDVTAPLNAYLRSVANGSTVHFPTNGQYRIEGTLYVQNKTGLTLDGHGSKFFPSTTTTNGSRAQWQLDHSTGLTVRNMVVRGSSTQTGPAPKYGGTGVFDPSLQWQHGISILSSFDVLVDNVDVRGTSGDLAYVGKAKGGVPSSGVTISNSTLVGSSRSGISVTNADHVTISNNTIDSVQYQLVNMEVHGPTDTITYITISGNAFGSRGGASISSGGGEAGDAHDIVIDSNRALDRGSVNGLDRYPFTVQVRPNPTRRWYNYRITNNVGAVFGINKALFLVVWVDNLTVTGNSAPVPASPAWPRVSALPYNEDHEPQRPLTAACMTGVTVSGNTFTPKPPGMPDSVVYPCR